MLERPVSVKISHITSPLDFLHKAPKITLQILLQITLHITKNKFKKEHY